MPKTIYPSHHCFQILLSLSPDYTKAQLQALTHHSTHIHLPSPPHHLFCQAAPAVFPIFFFYHHTQNYRCFLSSIFLSILLSSCISSSLFLAILLSSSYTLLLLPSSSLSFSPLPYFLPFSSLFFYPSPFHLVLSPVIPLSSLSFYPSPYPLPLLPMLLFSLSYPILLFSSIFPILLPSHCPPSSHSTCLSFYSVLLSSISRY